MIRVKSTTKMSREERHGRLRRCKREKYVQVKKTEALDNHQDDTLDTRVSARLEGSPNLA